MRKFNISGKYFFKISAIESELIAFSGRYLVKPLILNSQLIGFSGRYEFPLYQVNRVVVDPNGNTQAFPILPPIKDEDTKICPDNTAISVMEEVNFTSDTYDGFYKGESFNAQRVASSQLTWVLRKGILTFASKGNSVLTVSNPLSAKGLEYNNSSSFESTSSSSSLPSRQGYTGSASGSYSNAGSYSQFGINITGETWSGTTEVKYSTTLRWYTSCAIS